MVLFKAENVIVRVQRKEIVKKVSFEVKNERILLLGPNGAGKSTLAKAIAGLVKYQGNMYLDGKKIDGWDASKRAKNGIILVHQFPPKIEGVTVNELCDVLGIVPAIPLKELAERELFVDMSGGEKKLVELAISLALKPKLLILDEVDSGLDVYNLRRIGRLLNSCDCSMIIITHTGGITKYVDFDRVLLMKAGRIVRKGGRKLLKEYLGGKV